ncbi:hypothetical protein [Paenibacillus sp. ATY16]|uniref:hypothetical protein n=1 Tax=Paenibacillus sp. ATY16 TaxID=1759312 RepID=UPI00200D8D15|nr:hypothetical protein [Paenibacillus sp. ATY16]MCK9862039.1 hypothetical protein [Paenibacillus sp. ATY16]
MKTTSNLGLMKPEGTDVVDIENFNTNADTLDTTIGAMSTVPTTAKNIAGAIKEIHTAISNLDTTISDGEITTAKLADSAVTTVKLAANAVTGAKMANSTVTATQLADGAVISAKLADSGVSAGTYKSVTVDGKGRVTAGSNPTTLSGYGITDAAPLASPALTGTPTAPTAAVGANTTQIATTAFVNSSTTAAKISPAFTGTPTAPTAAAGTNTAQIATTAFVNGEVAVFDASIASLEKELASLKLVSTLKDVVDGASDYFFDDMTAEPTPRGSIAYYDSYSAYLQTAVSTGALTCMVTSVYGLRVGMEVTFQSLSTNTIVDRPVITAINSTTRTFTFTPALQASYSQGAAVYRSYGAKTASTGLKFKQVRGELPFDLSGSLQGNILSATAFTGSIGNYATNVASSVKFSSDFKYVMECSWNGTSTGFYKRDGDKYVALTTLGSSGLPTANSMGAFDISKDGKYGAYIVNGGAQLLIWKNENDSYVPLPTANIVGVPEGGYSLTFSPSGNYLICASTATTKRIQIWKRVGDTFTLLSNPLNIVPTSNINTPSSQLAEASTIVWSLDENYLMFPTSSAPYWCMYKRSGDSFTQLAVPIGNPSVWSVGISPDNSRVVLNCSYLLVYTFVNDTFTLHKTISQVRKGKIWWSPDSNYCVVTNSCIDGGSSDYAGIKYTVKDTSTTYGYYGLTGGTGNNYAWTSIIDESGSYYYVSSKSKVFANYGATIDVLQMDIRFTMRNTDPINSVIAFAESDRTATVTAAVSANGSGNESYLGTVTTEDMTSTRKLTTVSTANLNKGNAAVRITMSRASTTFDPILSKVTGAIQK